MFISTAVSALKTTFVKIITRQIHWSIRISLFGLVSTNVHVVSTNVYFLHGEVPCKSDEISKAKLEIEIKSIRYILL